MRTLGLSSLEERRLRDDLVALNILLRRRSSEGGTGLFSLGPSDGICVSGSRLCLGRFGLVI